MLAHVPPCEEPRSWQQQNIEQLRAELSQREQQLASQPAIEEAKGVLMHNFGIDAEEAFIVLRKLSQDTNTPLAELADQLVTELSGTASATTAQSTLELIEQLRELLRKPP